MQPHSGPEEVKSRKITLVLGEPLDDINRGSTSISLGNPAASLCTWLMCNLTHDKKSEDTLGCFQAIKWPFLPWSQHMTVKPSIIYFFWSAIENFEFLSITGGWLLSLKHFVTLLLMKELLEPNKFYGILILGMRFKFK